jgi:hypothetical protein
MLDNDFGFYIYFLLFPSKRELGHCQLQFKHHCCRVTCIPGETFKLEIDPAGGVTDDLNLTIGVLQPFPHSKPIQKG